MSDHNSNTSGGTDGTSTAGDSGRDETFASASSAPADDGGQPTGTDGPALADPDAALVRAEDLQLNDADGGEQTLEPQLGTAPDTVELVEPTLEPVRISDDTADAAELEAVAAEARRVAAEAEEAGRLAGGLQPPRKNATATAPPAGTAVTAGTAPTGAPAGDVGDAGGNSMREPESANTTEAAAETGALPRPTATTTPDQQPDARGTETTAATPAEEALQRDPTMPAGARTSTADSDSAPTNYKPLIWIGLAVILALVLIIVIVFNLLGNASASASEIPQHDQSVGTSSYPDAAARPVLVNG